MQIRIWICKPRMQIRIRIRIRKMLPIQVGLDLQHCCWYKLPTIQNSLTLLNRYRKGKKTRWLSSQQIQKVQIRRVQKPVRNTRRWWGKRMGRVPLTNVIMARSCSWSCSICCCCLSTVSASRLGASSCCTSGRGWGTVTAAPLQSWQRRLTFIKCSLGWGGDGGCYWKEKSKEKI